MVQKGLVGFFDSYLKKETLFEDKRALQEAYSPDKIPHREKEINHLASILAPSLRMEKPSNIFLYGTTGTGKTVVIKHVSMQLSEVAHQREIPLKIFYLNCKLKRVADTEYRLVAQLVRELGKDIPPTGLPTDEVYKIFYDTLDSKPQLVILLLDEIDQLIKKTGDDILYNLTRINSELKKSQVSLIGVSNNLMFTDNLDPRVKSSLSEEEILFAPYNALQLQEILKERSKLAFKKGCVSAGVIEKCAAYAAREHGDARRALELLRVAGEIAERNGLSNVEIKHIDEAEEKIERDRVLDIINTQPKQSQAVLYSILALKTKKKANFFTGEVYEVYKGVSLQAGLRPLTQRRVSDIIAELDMLGIISTQVISKGRYGRTRDMSIEIPSMVRPKIKKILEQSLDLY
jgi:cell division control protein 6